MPETLPTKGIRRIQWQPQTKVAVAESPFTFSQQVYAYPAQRNMATIELAPRSPADAKEWVSLFLRLNGPEGTFYFSDTVGQEPKGTPKGTPLVDGAGQTGASLVTDGWAANIPRVLAGGDWLSINDRLHQVTDDAATDSTGAATLSIWPHISTAPSDNDAIEIAAPRGIFRLVELPAWEWTSERILAPLTFSAVEVIVP